MTKIIDIAEKAKIEGTYIFDPRVLDRVSPEIKGIVEGTFPNDFYGQDILIYEGWSMRQIMESAMQLAVEGKTKRLEEENIQLRKVYSSSCPECGYQGCVRGRKACDSEIEKLERENGQLRARMDFNHFETARQEAIRQRRIEPEPEDYGYLHRVWIWIKELLENK